MKSHIREYWEKQGADHGPSHCASWGDNWAIDLEIETIGKYLSPGDRVLDAGCANGFSTLRQLSSGIISSIVGIDYADNMIRSANTALEKDKNKDRCEFRLGNITSLDFPDESFDSVYTTRVLINLQTWEEQIKGILECLRVVKVSGKVILSEGFWEPLMTLNAIRALRGLPPLVEHDFNRYLKFSNTIDLLKKLPVDFIIDDFSSIYYLGSRFLRDLVTDPTEHPGFTNPINKLFYEIQKKYSGGGMGIQQAIVITKRDALTSK